MERDEYKENYEFCLTYTREELEDLMDEYKIIGRDKLKNKDEICGVLARIVDFELIYSDEEFELLTDIEEFNLNKKEKFYEQLPSEMIEKISSYLSLEELQRLALTNRNISQYQNRYIENEFEVLRQKAIIKREIIKQQVQDFINTEENERYLNIYHQYTLVYIALEDNPHLSLEFLIELLKIISQLNPTSLENVWYHFFERNRLDVIKYVLNPKNFTLTERDVKTIDNFNVAFDNDDIEIRNLINSHPNSHPNSRYYNKQNRL